MENDVQQLIDLLYDMIDNAKGVPLGNDKCIIERNRALDYLDEIRAQMPAEVEEAKKLMAARAEYVANAKKEAEKNNGKCSVKGRGPEALLSGGRETDRHQGVCQGCGRRFL